MSVRLMERIARTLDEHREVLSQTHDVRGGAQHMFDVLWESITNLNAAVLKLIELEQFMCRPRAETGAAGVKVDIDARAKLVAAIKQAGGQRALAREWGVSQQYLCDVVNGRRPISESILDRLGLRRVVSYIDSRKRVV